MAKNIFKKRNRSTSTLLFQRLDLVHRRACLCGRLGAALPLGDDHLVEQEELVVQEEES